jgi:predicted RNA-binding protein with PUA-like domain
MGIARPGMSSLSFSSGLYVKPLLHFIYISLHMSYWLMKSEPEEVSIDDALALPDVAWFGVRNYQARNFMRDVMRVGDGVLFYHSSCAEPGIAGIAEVASTAYPDETQFDASSKYFDPKASRENPRWMLLDVKALRKTRLLSLSELRNCAGLEQMQVLKKGSRLSITPVTADEWAVVMSLLQIY